MAKHTAIITSGPSAVTKKDARHPTCSATSCDTRNDRPTPIEKLEVYSVMLRELSRGGSRSVSAFSPGM